MAIERKDEILGKAVSGDATAIPRYTLVDENGNTVAQHVALQLENPITQPGMPYNAAFANEVLAASGTTAGTPPNYTLAQPGFTLTDGATIRFKLHAALGGNGNMYLNVNGTGNRQVITPTWDAVYMSAAQGKFDTGMVLTAIYSSGISGWVLQSPTVGAFNGRQGNVIPQLGDYTSSMVKITSVGSTTVLDHIDDVSNPHAVYPVQIGALNAKANSFYEDASYTPGKYNADNYTTPGSRIVFGNDNSAQSCVNLPPPLVSGHLEVTLEQQSQLSRLRQLYITDSGRVSSRRRRVDGGWEVWRTETNDIKTWLEEVDEDIRQHKLNHNNPHATTAEQVEAVRRLSFTGPDGPGILTPYPRGAGVLMITNNYNVSWHAFGYLQWLPSNRIDIYMISNPQNLTVSGNGLGSIGITGLPAGAVANSCQTHILFSRHNLG